MSQYDNLKEELRNVSDFLFGLNESKRLVIIMEQLEKNTVKDFLSIKRLFKSSDSSGGKSVNLVSVVETNVSQDGEKNEPTCLWLGVAAEFVDEMKWAKIEMDFVSPKGAMYPLIREV